MGKYVRKCIECRKYVRFLREQGKEAPDFVGSCVPFRFGRKMTTSCNAIHGRDYKEWLELQVKFTDAEIVTDQPSLEELAIQSEKYRE